jgi:hypothetical protein
MKLSRGNFSWVLLEVISKISFNKLELRIDKVVEKKRIDLSNKVSKIFNNTVQEGPFKGMVISEDQFWGAGDKASKILGLYEKEIQNLINQIQEKNNFPTFIDIGGADGFFAVGSVKNNLFKNCEVFEISKRGRLSIEKSAIKNNVNDQISIKGEADEKILSLIENINNSVILCDIEGSEYDLFSEKLIKNMHPSNVIIEIHKNSNISLNEFEDKFKNLFSITKITQGPRSLKDFSELKNFNDNNRALLASEGRSYIQEWWHLSPK